MKKNVKIIGVLVSLVMLYGAGTIITNKINAQEKTYKIGDQGPTGGFIFYDKGNYSGGWRYLEAAPVDQSQQTKWGCFKKDIPGAYGKAIGTGKSNTLAIVKSCGEADTAAKLCTTYRGGGKSDWFMPSQDELNLIYTNLYNAGVGGFAGNFYWSSSEYNAALALGQLFNNASQSGGQGHDGKHHPQYVRAVRAF
jgi:hypothetical protein